MPASLRFRSREGAQGPSIVAWREQLAASWGQMRFETLNCTSSDGRHRFKVQVFPGALETTVFSVELFANALNNGAPVRDSMAGPHPDYPGVFIYSGEIAATRPASDYTVRIIPHHPGVSVPLECNDILWQR